jgi:hypothetical protein
MAAHRATLPAAGKRDAVALVEPDRIGPSDRSHRDRSTIRDSGSGVTGRLRLPGCNPRGFGGSNIRLGQVRLYQQHVVVARAVDHRQQR